MEKLQKQYANDKAMYNQKLMEMYKENGISMFSSCLPAILSLVVFFVAISAFNSFSQYANIQNYNSMADSYNAYLNPYCAELKEENISDFTLDGENGETQRFLLIKDEAGRNRYIYYTVGVLNEKLRCGRFCIYQDFGKDLLRERGKNVRGRGMENRGGRAWFPLPRRRKIP